MPWYSPPSPSGAMRFGDSSPSTARSRRASACVRRRRGRPARRPGARAHRRRPATACRPALRRSTRSVADRRSAVHQSCAGNRASERRGEGLLASRASRSHRAAAFPAQGRACSRNRRRRRSGRDGEPGTARIGRMSVLVRRRNEVVADLRKQSEELFAFGVAEAGHRAVVHALRRVVRCLPTSRGPLRSARCAGRGGRRGRRSRAIRPRSSSLSSRRVIAPGCR